MAPRAKHRLNAKAVVNAGPGKHADGGGLYLRVNPEGGKRWVYIFQSPITKRPREIGLGDANLLSLKDARHRHEETRKLVAEGKGPHCGPQTYQNNRYELQSAGR